MYSVIYYIVIYLVDSIKIYRFFNYSVVFCGTDFGIVGYIVFYFIIGVFGIVFCKA